MPKEFSMSERGFSEKVIGKELRGVLLLKWVSENSARETVRRSFEEVSESSSQRE